MLSGLSGTLGIRYSITDSDMRKAQGAAAGAAAAGQNQHAILSDEQRGAAKRAHRPRVDCPTADIGTGRTQHRAGHLCQRAHAQHRARPGAKSTGNGYLCNPLSGGNTALYEQNFAAAGRSGFCPGEYR